MIGSLSGIIEHISPDSILLSVGGVGYRVFVLPGILSGAQVGDTTLVYTHLHVREDDMSLYGFASIRELTLFELLLHAPGVGPKSAMGVMALSTVDTLVSAILQGDAVLLTKVSGIGRKTAERIVVELKSKLERSQLLLPTTQATHVHADIVAALEELGYSETQAREAVRTLPADVDSVEAGLRAVLKAFGQTVERRRS